MKRDTLLHKEAILTNHFINYLITSKSYNEVFDDKNTSGSDPFDSIGFIGQKLVLIEFKNTISPGQVFYKGSKGSSIEKKIGTVLKLIYQQIDSRTYNSLVDKIDNEIVPDIWLIANSISERTIHLLRELLASISLKWQFNYKVSTWKNNKENVLIERKNKFLQHKIHSQIKIPDFPNTARKRNPRLTYQSIVDTLSDDNIAIFKQLYETLIDIGLSPSYNINNVNFKKEKQLGALLGIWPLKSNKKGLLITYDFHKLKAAFNIEIISISSLGLIRNEFKVGNLGFNSYIISIEQVDNFMSLLTRSSYDL